MKTKTLSLCSALFLVVMLASCSHRETQIPVKETWDCRESDLKDTFDIQSLFGDRYLITLEETGQSRVGSIEKLVKVDSLLFVMDSRLAMRVFVFNATTDRFINSVKAGICSRCV